jgi:hypothetical protein
MQFEVDQEKFDSRQAVFALELAKTIKFTLDNKGVDENLVDDITETLLFNIGALLDGSTVVGTETEPIISFLAFHASEDFDSNIIVSPVGSYIHEIVMSIADEVSQMTEPEEDWPES